MTDDIEVRVLRENLKKLCGAVENFAAHMRIFLNEANERQNRSNLAASAERLASVADQISKGYVAGKLIDDQT